MAGCKTCGGQHPDNACLEDTATARRGMLIDGRYEVVEELGRGGMGAVFRAKHATMGREVAIKLLAADLQRDPVQNQRFLREARLTGELMHPNIVTVFDAGDSDQGLYLVMELVRGTTLSALAHSEQLSWTRIIKIALQICDALGAAHARGIIHRDLKASNVMVLRSPAGDDLVKVVDFGLAHALHDTQEPLTAPEFIVGSANAIAPEVVLSRAALSPKADLYALGSMLYELLTKQRPYGAGPFELILKRQLTTDPEWCTGDFPQSLGAVVMTLMRRDPNERPASALVVADLLRATLDAPTQGSSRPTVAAPKPKLPVFVIPTIVTAGVVTISLFLAALWNAKAAASTQMEPAPTVQQTAAIEPPPPAIPIKLPAKPPMPTTEVPAVQAPVGAAEVDAGRPTPDAGPRNNKRTSRNSAYFE